MNTCEFCPDGHENPLRRPWAVYVHPTERDGDGQPISLIVGKTGCQHVAESDAEWLRQIIRDARQPGKTDDLAQILASATVLHLQPDDRIVIGMNRPITPEIAIRIRDAFKGRQVVVLDQGVSFDVVKP